MSYIYLASPYTHPSKNVMARRANSVAGLAGQLIAKGKTVVSPIAHGHLISRFASLPPHFEAWRGLSESLIASDQCEKVMVYMLPGWRESEGVKAEVALAAKLGKKVTYLFPDTFIEGSLIEGESIL